MTLLVSGTAVAAAVAPGVPAAASAATIVVTPSTSLVAGQSVSVSGSGFGAGASLVAAECKAGSTSLEDCNTGNAAFPIANADGDAAFQFTVAAFLDTANGPVDCTTTVGSCVVSVADIAARAATTVTAPLSFAPPDAPRAGALGVPSAPVASGTGVDVSATGFVPYGLIEVSLCAAGAVDAGGCAAPELVELDDAGSASFLLAPSNDLTTQGGATIDCTQADACAYAAWDFRDFSTLTTAAVRLAPQVPGSLTIDPATGLRPHETVAVSGNGWPATVTLELSQCDGSDPTTARCGNFASVTTDATGAFTAPYAARSELDVGSNLDCETTSCFIVVTWYASGGSVAAAQPVAFAPLPITVKSRYSTDELAAISGAATTLGVSIAEEQREGALALAYVLGLGGSTTLTTSASRGAAIVSTAWPPDEFDALASTADTYGTTVPRFQKTGALALAYVLAISG